jgi:hypothetical protein
MRVLKRAATGLTLLAGVGLIGAGLVGAETSGSSSLIDLSASASGVHLIVAMPDFVAVERFIDGGGPTAQASLSTLGGPSSYAAQPYPGEIAIAFPGLMKVVGFPVDVPPYPFYVNASATKPESKLSQPGFELSATAGATDAASSAQSGQASDQAVVGHARSTAHTWLDGPVFRSEAVSTGDLFKVGPLRLAGMKSKATASIPASGGAPTLASELEVAAASVNDVPVTFTPGGVTLGGSKVPLPKDNPITKALDQAGVSVEYLAASTSENTVVSPGLRIRAFQTFPGANKQLQVTYLIGMTVAHAGVSAVAGDGGAAVPDLPLTSAPNTSTPEGTGQQSTGADAVPGVVLPGISGAGSTGNGAVRAGTGGGAVTGAANDATVPATGETANDETSAASAGSGPGVDGSLALSESDLPKTSSKSIYLVLAGSALLAALALHGLRQLGVRAPARVGS